MNRYKVREVGEPMGQWLEVDAYSETEAVVGFVGCPWQDVGMPISYGGFSRRYMPFWTGRQVDVFNRSVMNTALATQNGGAQVAADDLNNANIAASVDTKD